MIQKKFLLQGFTAETHLVAIEHLFACPNLERVILSVAFVNKAGVELIASQIENAIPRVEVFAGIRNQITTLQGLEQLLILDSILYVVDTGTRHRVFHPKIYYARGKNEARIIVGSANLTLGGLSNNIEASIALDLDLNDLSNLDIVTNIENELSNLVGTYPRHVFNVTEASGLVSLQNEGRLVDESVYSHPRAISNIKTGKADGLPQIKLKVSPVIPLIKHYTRHERSDVSEPDSSNVEASEPTPTDQGLELVWRSKPLTIRDLNISSGSNTHLTGSINLDKGLLEKTIDHRHYFRDEIFSALIWTPKNTTNVEESSAKFGLIIKGVDYGEFELKISHSTNTESKSYKQRNAMTRLRWGPMRKHIEREELIGRTLSLYRNVTDSERFVVEID